MLQSFDLPGAVVYKRSQNRRIRQTSIDRICRYVLSLLCNRFIRLRRAADKWHDLVLPIDFCERIGSSAECNDIRVKRLMQKEVPVVDLVVLVDTEADLPQM